MKKRFEKLCAVMLAFCMVLPCISVHVYAAQVTSAFVSGWSKFVSNEPDATVNLAPNTQDGGYAVKITNNTAYDGTRYMRIFQNVKLEKDTTYIYGLKVKAIDVAGAEITFFGNKSSLVPFSKNFDWTKYEFQNTYTGASGTQGFNITVVDTAKGFYVDDVYLYKCVNGKAEGENLLTNPGFENDVKNVVNDETETSQSSETADLTIVDAAEFLETSKSIPVFRTMSPVGDISAYDWSSHPKINISDVYFTNKSVSTADNTSSVRYAYDDNNLYLNFEVEDNVHNAFLNSSFWQGDSVQFAFANESGRMTEAGVCFDAQTGEVYCTNEKVSAKCIRTGTTSVYYITAPWTVFTDKLPESFRFSAIINDNDNDEYQRKYAQQISLGIVSAKNSEQFPTLYPTDTSKTKHFAAIEGDTQVYVSAESTFMLMLQNLLGENAEYIAKFPGGKTSRINMPPQSCAMIRFKYSSDTVGDKDITVSLSRADKADEEPFDVHYAVRVIPDYAMYLNLKDECTKYYDELKTLVEKCKKNKIAVDYETADLTVFEMHLGYMTEDAEKYGAFDRVLYTYDCLRDIYTRCKGDMEKYLVGEKKSYAVPKYVNSEIEATKTGFIADMELDGKVTRRPMFLNGLLNFVQGEKEYVNFTKLGVNAEKLSLKLYDIVTQWCEVPEWNLYERAKQEVDYSVNVSSEAAKSGKYSLKLERTTPWGSGRTIYLRQAVPCKPNTTYRFGLSSKGKAVDGVYFACHTIISSNFGLSQRKENYIRTSADWVDHEFTYTTAEDDHTLEFIIPLMAVTDDLYIDDIFIKEEGSDKNLIRNGDFEKGADTDVKEYDFYDGYLREFECRLKEFEKANINVDVLLAANYWPEFIDLKYPDVVDDNTQYGEYLRFNTGHPEVKKVLKIYADAVMGAVKKSSAVKSICLGNEPYTYAFNTQYYKPFWYEYLKNIYGNDINKLNEVCKTDYKAFEEIEMKGQKEFTVLYKHSMEFNEDVLADYLGYLGACVKASDPDMPVHAKLLPITVDYGRSALTKGENYEKLAPIFDYNGNDANTAYNHPKQSLLSKMEWYDLQTSVKDAPVLNTEDHFQMDSVNIDYSPKMLKHAMADAWQGVMHNRAQSMVWVLEREQQYLTGTTWMNTNLAARADLLSGHSRAFLDFNRLSYEITAMQNVKRSAAILYSQNSYNFKPSFENTLLSAYSNVLFSGLKPLLLTESQMQKLDDYNLLIIPECTNVYDSTFDAIKKFVSRGGKLVIVGEDSLRKNEFDMPRNQREVDKLYENAVIVKTDTTSRSDMTTAADLPETIKNVTDGMNLTNVKIVYKNDGLKVKNTEWLSTPYNGGYLVNMCRYKWGGADDIEIYIDGKKAEKIYDLRKNEYMDADNLKLEEYTPLFVRIDG